jgi:uncharacterized protein
MIVASFYAALLGLLCIVLSILVIRQRLAKRVSLGDGGDPGLTRASRVFGNFAEYAALFLVLLALAESLGTPARWLHVYGAAFVIGRIAHAVGVTAGNGGRQAGMILTFGTLGALSVSLLVATIGKL